METIDLIMKRIIYLSVLAILATFAVSCDNEDKGIENNGSGEQGSGYQYVDLGLSVNWATFNVGATRPEEYGDYYAWGETEPKSKYDWSTYKFCTGPDSSLTKYNTKSESGRVDNKLVLDPEDDVAHVKWGADWRMPTVLEIEELCDSDNCKWTWTSQNGVNGFKVVSKIPGYEGKSIFIPAGGFYYGSELDSIGSFVLLYSSSLATPGSVNYGISYDHRAFIQIGISSSPAFSSYVYRKVGIPVRPVCTSKTFKPRLKGSVLLSVSFNYTDQDSLWGKDWKDELQYNWNEISYGSIGYTKPRDIKGTIYSINPSTDLRSSAFYRIYYSDGGKVMLDVGSKYDFLYYTFGTEYVNFYQSDDYMSYTAFTRSDGDYYRQPDEFYGSFMPGIELSDDPEDYEKSVENDNVVYYKNIDVSLKPYSFIYLYQIVFLNNTDNNGRRIIRINDIAVSGVSQGVDMFTGKTFDNAVSIKTDEIKPMQNLQNVRLANGSTVNEADIVAARMITWGLPGTKPLEVGSSATNTNQNNINITVMFRNAKTGTITRDITDQMRQKPTGGIITIYIDSSQIEIPQFNP